MARSIPTALITLVVALLAGPPANPSPTADQASDDTQPPLWELIEEMGDRLTEVKHLLRKNDSYAHVADHAQQMQSIALRSKSLTPPMLANMPASSERDELAITYRLAMIQLTQSLLDLEAAALRQDKDTAFKVIDSLVKPRFQGHLKYRKTLPDDS